MKHNWENKKVESFITKADNKVKVLPDREYSLLGLRLEGRGLFVREQKLGVEISSKYLNRIKPNQFIYSRLFAWKGAFDITRNEFSDTFVSNEFPAFEIDEDKADLKFLYYYFNQPKVWNEVEQYCIGVTKASRNRFKEKYFFDLEIPLPPLSEQKRIVAKIESVKSKIETIREIRAEQEKELGNLRYSVFIDLQKSHNNIPIGEILVPKKNQITLNPIENYKQVTVKVGHRGVVLRGLKLGSEIKSKQYLANEGDFIISKIDARNGSMGMIPKELDNSIVTGDFPLFNFTKEVNPTYFFYFSNTSYFDNSCIEASEGTTNRRRLKLNRFYEIRIPLPPLEEQNRIVRLLEKSNTIRQQYQAQEVELEELLSSLLDKAFKGEL